MARNPDGIFTVPFAGTGDKAPPTFPITTGWPQAYESTAVPLRTTFNYAFNQTYSTCVDINEMGATLQWDATIPYVINAMVMGSNGIVYRALIANAGVDPITPAPATWEAQPTATQVSTLETDVTTLQGQIVQKSDIPNLVMEATSFASQQFVIPTLTEQPVNFGADINTGSDPVQWVSSTNRCLINQPGYYRVVILLAPLVETGSGINSPESTLNFQNYLYGSTDPKTKFDLKYSLNASPTEFSTIISTSSNRYVLHQRSAEFEVASPSIFEIGMIPAMTTVQIYWGLSSYIGTTNEPTVPLASASIRFYKIS